MRSDLARTVAVGLGKVQNRRQGKDSQEWVRSDLARLVEQRLVGAGKEGSYRQHGGLKRLINFMCFTRL